MSEEIEELVRRLVVGHKCDGRAVYDEQAKAELAAMCRRPGASVSRLARRCGVNANQLSRWVRELERGQIPRAVSAQATEPPPAAFVPVQLESTRLQAQVAVLNVKARLPNGVVLDVASCDLQQAAELIDALGSLPCSASTKG